MRFIYKFFYAILELCLLPISLIIFLWKVAATRAAVEHSALYQAKDYVPLKVRNKRKNKRGKK